MDTIAAIKARHSVRDFKSEGIPKVTVMKIMEAALNSPSGGNGQPWEVFIAAGATMERIRTTYKTAEPVPAGPPGLPAGMPPQPAYMAERMKQIRQERMKLLGLDPDDPASGAVFAEWSARLYNAPVMAIICQDKMLTSNLDIGLFIQTICLAAINYGVDTLIAAAFVMRQEIVRKELKISDEPQYCYRSRPRLRQSKLHNQHLSESKETDQRSSQVLRID